MSDLSHTEEDWSIISSSSDFEDDPATPSSVTKSPQLGNTPLNSDQTDMNIDESVATIEDTNSEVIVDAANTKTQTPNDMDADTANTLLPLNADGDVATPPALPTITPITNITVKNPMAQNASAAKSCAAGCVPGIESVRHAAAALVGAVASAFVSVDLRARAVSSALYRAVMAPHMNRLRVALREKDSLNSSLLSHIAYSLLVPLERNQEVLVYWALGAVTMAASGVWFASCWNTPPVVELTYAQMLHHAWTTTMYEPEQSGWGWFWRTNGRKLRAARYMDTATSLAKQAWRWSWDNTLSAARDGIAMSASGSKAVAELCEAAWVPMQHSILNMYRRHVVPAVQYGAEETQVGAKSAWLFAEWGAKRAWLLAGQGAESGLLLAEQGAEKGWLLAEWSTKKGWLLAKQGTKSGWLLAEQGAKSGWLLAEQGAKSAWSFTERMWSIAGEKMEANAPWG